MCRNITLLYRLSSALLRLDVQLQASGGASANVGSETNRAGDNCSRASREDPSARATSVGTDRRHGSKTVSGGHCRFHKPTTTFSDVARTCRGVQGVAPENKTLEVAQDVPEDIAPLDERDEFTAQHEQEPTQGRR